MSPPYARPTKRSPLLHQRAARKPCLSSRIEPAPFVGLAVFS